MLWGELHLNVEEKEQALLGSKKPDVVVMITEILGAIIEALVVHTE